MAIRRPTNYDATADIIADLDDMADSIQDELDLKVDKVQGKGLSTNDYTTEEKNKLAGVEAQANKTVVDVSLNETSTNPVQNKAIYAELAEKQAEIDGLVTENTAFKKQISTEHISTSSTQLTDSAEGLQIENVKIKGQTSQEQYEGYNLLDLSNLDVYINNGATGQVIDAGIKVTTAITADNPYVKYKVLDLTNYAGQQISVSATIKSSANNKGMLLLTQNNSNASVSSSNTTYDESQATTNGNYKVTMTVANEITDNNRYLWMTAYGRRGSTGASANESVEYTNLMIYIGNETKLYEKYVGGQPAPNPAYPQLIHRVTGDCGSKFQNKNYIKANLSTCSYNGIECKNNNDGSFTFNGTATGNASFRIDQQTRTGTELLQKYEAGTYTLKLNGGIEGMSCSVTNGTDSINSTASTAKTKTVEEISNCYTYIAIVSGTVINNITVYPMLEKSSTATDYIPHAEQNAPLSLDNIELYDGDKIQISYINKAGYKKITGANTVKSWKKKVFNGTQNKIDSRHEMSTSEKSFFKITLEGKSQIYSDGYTGASKCNYLKNVSGTANTAFSNNNDGLWWEGSSTYSYVILPFATIADANNWLQSKNTAGKPLEIVYKLNELVTTPITDQTLLAQLETLINMKTYKEVTNIDLTGEDLAPVLDCDYYQDMSTIKSRIFSYDSATQTLTITI
jgi:hypothetical protein